MSSKRSSSGPHAVPPPIGSLNPHIMNPPAANIGHSYQPDPHRPLPTIPPTQRSSALHRFRCTSLPRDNNTAMELSDAFNPQILNASAADSMPLYRPGQGWSSQPPSATLRRRSASYDRRHDNLADVKWNGSLDSLLMNTLASDTAPPYSFAQDEGGLKTPPPRATPSSPPPRRRAVRVRGRNQGTYVEDASKKYTDREIHADDFYKDVAIRASGRRDISGFAAQNTYGTIVPMDTPVIKRVASQVGAPVPQDARSKYLRYAEEASKYVMGPMPVKEFLAFLPYHDGLPDYTGAFDEVHVGGPEPKVYPRLIKAIEDGGFCPTLKFVNTSTAGEEHGQGDLKPDISAFDNLNVDSLKQIDNPKAQIQGERYEANLGLAEVTMEDKPKDDPFCDDASKEFLDWLNPPKNPNADLHETQRSKDKKAAFGQVVCYAVHQSARQHRAFLFSVMLIGTHARLFRWDRAGIIVTESFDYVEDPRSFCEFLWRFGHATPAQRGYDPTVTVASKTEERLFRDSIAEEVAFQLGIKRSDEKLAKAMKRHYEPGKVTKVKVFNDEGDNSNFIECLISVPVALPRSVTGRGGRGYWAVILTDPRKGTVVFLKDVWRVDVSANLSEGEIYDEMMENEVENISGKLYGGDVVYEREDGGLTFYGLVQTTLSQEYINESWMNETLKFTKQKGRNEIRIRVYKHTHYRMILEDVGYPLSEFTGSRELFEAARDVVIALISAYEKCNRLHRDVSINNIILVRRRGSDRRNGVLIDWEFSVKADREGCSTDYARSGTWAFMSAASLKAREGSFRHTRGDDFESVLYVLIYAGVHWLAHSYDDGLGAWIDKFFYDSTPGAKGHKGGATKKEYITDGDFADEFEFSTECINIFFSNMYKDLGSTGNNVQTTGFQSKWTASNVVNHFDKVCAALKIIPGTEMDRVVNDRSDSYQEIQEVPRATCTSSRLTTEDTSRRLNDSLVGTSIPRGSKRVVRDDGLVASGNKGMASDAKRKRVQTDSRSVLVASGSLDPPPPSTTSNRARSSIQERHSRIHGSSESHRMSRRASKNALPKHY